MITWFTIAQITVALVAMFACLVQFARRRLPNDYTLGATLFVGLLLVVQVIISIVAPATGNHAMGDPLEFWMYLIVALILPFGATVWALIDRKPSAHLVLVIVNLSVAVMLYRMLVIWG